MALNKKDLLDLIRKRRSIRLFTGIKLSKEEILSIIEAGIWAPSGCNMQELRFLILEGEEQLREIVRFKPFLQGLSHFILMFYDTSLLGANKMYCKSKHQRNLPYIDAGLALQNMALYAKSRGIDSCVCNFSDYYFMPPKNKLERFKNELSRRLHIHTLMSKNFRHYLKNKLRIPSHLKVIAGLALGYGKNQPDLNMAMHDGRKIMRKGASFYILNKKMD